MAKQSRGRAIRRAIGAGGHAEVFKVWRRLLGFISLTLMGFAQTLRMSADGRSPLPRYARYRVLLKTE